MTAPRRKKLLGAGGGESYLLRDDFSDTLAAGSVNGTLAVPGPGTRTVIDTNTKLSIGGNAMTMAAGAASFDGLFHNAQARVAGEMLISKNTPVDTAGRHNVGWSAAQSSLITDEIRFSAGGPLEIRGLVAVGAYTAVLYRTAHIMRANGYYYFIKGGVFTKWTLLLVLPTGNNASMYPGNQVVIGSNGYSVDFMRVPVTLWLPIPLASDGFSAAAATDGLGHAETSGLGSGGANVPWAAAATWAVAGGVAANTLTLGAEQATGALVVGTWYQITATEVNHFYTGCAVEDVFRAAATTGLDANNKVKALTLAELFRPLNTAFTPDVVAQVKQTAQDAGTPSGIGIRLNSATAPTSGIIAYFDGLGNIKCVEFSGATYTQLFTAVKAFAANDSLQLIADGANVRLIHLTSAGAPTLIGSTAAATITTGGYHGLFSTDVGNTLDNFVCHPRGTGNEYSVLDKWSK